MQGLDLRLRLAILAVVVWLLADFGVMIGAALTIAGLGGTGAIWSQAALQRVDSFTVATGIFFGLASIASAIFVGRWIYRASENAHALSDEMTISPGWAVGWYFVPFATLFKPYQAMREIWQASLAPHNPGSVQSPPIMQIWWMLWIATSILGNISFRVSLGAKTINDFLLGSWIDIISFAVDVPLALLLITLMRQVSANQRSIDDAAIFE